MFFGQNLEDKIINEYITQKYGADFIGSILEIGANDGVTLSNSRYFYVNSWKAYLVEAGKTPFQFLMFNTLAYENVYLYNVAIGNENNNLTFYESSNLLHQNDIGLVSSLLSEETKKWRDAGITYESYKVHCLTWSNFLTEFGLNNKKFDIISIDIEGMDYEVLSQMNLTELGCKILCVEFNGKEKNKYVDYAKKFNLHLVTENAENLIFAL
jgi:FkbM family methyltransferase